MRVEAERLSWGPPFELKAGSGGQYALNTAARSWTVLWLILQATGWTPTGWSSRSLLPVRVSFRHGRGSFSEGLTSNPAFYELVMGWPAGWTDPEASVMGFAVWLRRSRGALCALPTASEARGAAPASVAPTYA